MVYIDVSVMLFLVFVSFSVGCCFSSSTTPSILIVKQLSGFATISDVIPRQKGENIGGLSFCRVEWFYEGYLIESLCIWRKEK